MGCIYSDFNGFCTLWDKDSKGKNYTNSAVGWSQDDDGTCVVEDDEDPGYTCQDEEDENDEDE